MSSNVAWLKARARLEEESKSKPDDPETLRLLGEAQMMSGEATKAVQTLQKAHDINLKPNDPAILADLGAAYALRGDVEHQYGDYLSAIENLGQSLHLKPREPEVVFNLALALEKAQLKDQAIEQWKVYLELDPLSDWAREARQHLDDLEKALQSREEALHQTVDDPAQFLARVAAGDAIDAEAYLRDIVVTKWLPLSTSDGPARQATIKLAQILKDRHGDTWLDDLVNSIKGPETLPAVQKLAAARTGNQHGDDMEAALAASREAALRFLHAGGQPGRTWARFEEVSSLHGLLHHPECVMAADSLIRDLDTHSYLWLRAQVRIENAICLMRLARLGEASVRLREAREMAHLYGLAGAELRASVQYIDCIGHTGLPSEAFSGANECLRAFWSGTHSALYFQQVTGKLLDITTRSEQKYASLWLARSGAWAADKTLNPYAQAPAHANLAAAAQHVGLETEARANLDMAEKLYARTPAGYRVQPEISLASVEVEGGDADGALKRLLSLSATLPSVLLETSYYSVLGEAYRRKALLSSAVEAFRRSIDIGRHRVISVPSERERAGVLKAIEPSYRGLVATLLDSSGAASALTEWQSFRALDAAGISGAAQPCEGLTLSFAEMREGYVCWLTRRGQLVGDCRGVSGAPLNDVARRFLRECSDPTGDSRRLRKDAQQLYRWIVAPLTTQLTEGDREITLELDGVFRGIPVQALVAGDGRYFGDRFSLLLSAGCATSRRTALPGGNANVLVVANAEVTGAHAAQFPPLPETLEEAEAIRAAFPASTILEGPLATVDAFRGHLPGTSIVHFAGHGYSDSATGGLLFAPRTPETEDYQLLRSSDLRSQDWSSCGLAVLSACAAAEGETQGPHNPDSLVRGLTRAGVSRVLASLWNVDSAATRQLMSAFYESLARGSDPAQALRLAQQRVRQRPGWEHPYYWAGFQLYGTTWK